MPSYIILCIEISYCMEDVVMKTNMLSKLANRFNLQFIGKGVEIEELGMANRDTERVSFKNVLIAGSGNVTGMNVIRALVGNDDINIYGCDYDAVNPSNQWCVSFSVPRCEEDGYNEAILKIVKDKSITHIIATNDHDVRALSLLRKAHDNMPTINGFSDNILKCLDKRETIDLFSKAGVKTPEIVNSKTDYPYVLRKESMGNKQKFVHIIKNDADLLSIPEDHFENGIMTRYVSGIEYTADILCDNISPR